MFKKTLVLAAFISVLVLPFVVRMATGRDTGARADGAQGKAARVLVIATPHVEQIRLEFALAFSDWHQRMFNQPVRIDWRTPGGTSEIIRLLEASFASAATSGKLRDDGSFEPGTTGFDILFGGGSFELGKMREPKSAKITRGGQTITLQYRMGIPAGFSNDQLRAWFAPIDSPADMPMKDYNVIGTQTLFDPPNPERNDPGQYWIGTALSGFGIVYNRDMLAARGLDEPQSFKALADPRYFSLLALTDPRMSGSVTTTYESIINGEGWSGWRTLRAMSANARYFASSATRPPIDVSQGEAMAALAIDFYGRGQSQFVLAQDQDPADSRVGYIDPPGAVYIDADPISILNGCTDVELARRFVEFVLSDHGQTLWQLPAHVHSSAASNPVVNGVRLGPRFSELRRLPVSRAVYARYGSHFIDTDDPFAAAAKFTSKGWRSAIAPLMTAACIDSAEELRSAWGAIIDARAAGRASQSVLDEAESKIFDSFPPHISRPGALTPEEVAALSKPAFDELLRRRLPTIALIEGAIPVMMRDLDRAPDEKAKAALQKVIDELQALLAARPAGERDAVWERPFSDATFKGMRLDTDSWRDPEHGRRTLIRYTQWFKATYRAAEDAVR
jgi:iron(III) transport system substrate-binding protein